MKARLIGAGGGALSGLVGGGFLGARMHFQSGVGVSTIVMLCVGVGLAGALAGYLMGDKLIR